MNCFKFGVHTSILNREEVLPVNNQLKIQLDLVKRDWILQKSIILRLV